MGYRIGVGGHPLHSVPFVVFDFRIIRMFEQKVLKEDLKKYFFVLPEVSVYIFLLGAMTDANGADDNS